MTASRPAPRRRWAWLRYALSVLAAGVLLYLFWPLLGEVRAAAHLLGGVRWTWLLAALALQFAGYTCLTTLNVLLLRPFPGRIRFWRLMATLTAMACIEVALPSAGASGVLLRIRLLGDDGFDAEVATVTLVLETVFEVAVRTVVSVSGLWYLLGRGELSSRQIVALLLAAVLALILGAGLWRLGQNRERVDAWLLAGLRRWNRLAERMRWPPTSPQAARARLAQLYAGWSGLRRRPTWPLWSATAGHVACDVASLGLCFYAFGYLVPPSTLLIGYGLMLVLSGLAALPGGLGLTEASLAVIFARLGAPGAVAIAAALTYRLLAFWLLRLVGFASWQVLEVRRGSGPADTTAF